MSYTLEESLQKEGCIVTTTVGTSMYPMLRSRQDTVVISPVYRRLKKYDVALYRRGNSYVLHRVVKVLPDSYVICGDNCLNREYHITDDSILGVMTECCRGEKKIDLNGWRYKIYVRLWCGIYPLRYIYKRICIKIRSKRERSHESV